jgi:methyl-accepting chemotaxis protein
MSEDAFRIVVTVAVILAAIAFIVQGFVMLALYGVVRKMQQKVAPLIDKGEAVAASAMPVIQSVKPLVEEKVKPLLDQASGTLKKVGPVLEKAGPAVDRVTAILTSTHGIIEENRPRIAEIATDAAAIVKNGREQAQNLGNLIHDASERTRIRLEQIDKSVDNTVEQVEQIGENVKRAAMRPVREVNGIAAGISAAVSTLVHGSRRSSVDHATQDEEMFI